MVLASPRQRLQSVRAEKGEVTRKYIVLHCQVMEDVQKEFEASLPCRDRQDSGRRQEEEPCTLRRRTGICRISAWEPRACAQMSLTREIIA